MELALHRLSIQLALRLTIGILLIGALSYVALRQVTAWRETHYFEQMLALPMQLLHEGVGRHADDPAQQEQWLELAGRILTAQLTVVADQGDQRELRVNHRDSGIVVTGPMPDGQVLELAALGWGEPQWRATLFLILNELGRVPADQQQATLSRLASQSPYALTVIALDSVDLNPRYQRMLEQGQTVMELRQQPGAPAALEFFAPFGDTPYLLSLGPVPLFETYPPRVLASIGTSAALLSLLLAVLLARPMVLQIRAIETELDQIQPNQLAADLSFAEKTPFDSLASKISSMTRRIENLVRLQQDTVGAISHDLRTPISRLRLRAEMIRRHLPAAQQYRADALEDDLRDLQDLANEVVHYVSLSRDQTLPAGRCDALQVVRRLMKGQLQDGPQLAWQIGQEGEAMVALPEGLLHRLVDNLLSNAIRYAKSRVAVTVRPVQGELEICVGDDGPGIAPSEHDKVFEPFWRPDHSRQRQTGGHGLGLAIVKRIVERANGQITLNQDPSGGAQFTVRLPILEQSTTSRIQMDNNSP